MKIKRINFKNIKSFNNELNIEFNDKINILIGSNGCGKSNLLDIITIVIRHYFSSSYLAIDENRPTKRIKKQEVFQNIGVFLDKFIGNKSESIISLDFEITKEDLNNLNTIKKNLEKFENINIINNDYFMFIDQFKKFDIQKLENRTVSYNIRDCRFGFTEPLEISKFYCDFLIFLDLFIYFSKDIQDVKINETFLYFPPYRVAETDNLRLGLSENTENLLSAYKHSISKNITTLTQLTTIHFAEKRRLYESQGNLDKWKNDSEVKLVTKYLKRLGYEWDLKCINLNKNVYEIVLFERGREFSIQQASSGEKELINFLLGIFAFDIKDGLIIVDEPELHLHPKWQSILMDLFMELSDLNGNQFILSTHSPNFITPKTISNVIRIYKEDDSSNAIKMDENSLKNAKDLLHIINSHNNEKMFFADKIVLVEGIHDRLVFNKLIKFYSKKHNIQSSEVIEVLEVHGKTDLLKYRNFLNELKINNIIIADFDFLKQIGDNNIKKLFKTSFKKINEDVVNKIGKGSKDGENLAKEIEKTILTEDISKLSEIWTYIKARNTKINEILSNDENMIIDEFIDDKKLEEIFILRNGEIEDYLPLGYKNKDTAKLIELLKDENFSQWLEVEDLNIKELESIILEILK